jgi:hypothetical protein
MNSGYKLGPSEIEIAYAVEIGARRSALQFRSHRAVHQQYAAGAQSRQKILHGQRST